MQRRIIRQYFLLSFLFSAGGMQIISAVYVTFLLKNGLNLFEVNLVNAVFFFTLFICEIPTGAFADIFGRKTAFVAACGMTALGMFVYGSSSSFVGFVCAEILCAIGATFRTGAFQAWLVDNLKHYGGRVSYRKIFARESLFNQVGGGLGAIAGSYIAVNHPAMPWFIGASFITAVMILAQMIMKEEYFVHSVFSWRAGLASMREVALTSIRYGANHKAVRFILIITFVQIYSVQALNMYWQPFFKSHGLKEAHFGFLMTGIMVSLALGAFLASRIKGSGKERPTIVKSQVFVGSMVILAALSAGLPLLVIFFLLHEVGRGFWGPMKDSYLHQRIPSHERATIVSFCAVAPHIGGAIGLVISGGIAQAFGISAAWVVGGTVFILGALLVGQNGKTPE